MKILKAGGYVWADRGKVHKQGKVIRDYAIFPLKTNYVPMAPIMPVDRLDMDRDLNLKIYPDFWVDLRDCVESETPNPVPVPVPTPVTSEITDAQAGQAFVTLAKWISWVFK